jgi:hypothetical protein
MEVVRASFFFVSFCYPVRFLAVSRAQYGKKSGVNPYTIVALLTGGLDTPMDA